MFRRSPVKRADLPRAKKGPQVQILQGARGFRYINYQNRPHDISENPMDSPKIRNAVFCAVILEEFVKELAAYSQEQAVLAQSEVWPWVKLIACFGSYIYCQTLCGNKEFLLSMQSTYQMNLIHLFTTVLLSNLRTVIKIFLFFFINEGNVMTSVCNTPVLIWIIIKHVSLFTLKGNKSV